MISKTTLIAVGVVAASAGGGGAIAGAAGADSRSSTKPIRVTAATARGDDRREHRSECVRERSRNPRDFRRDHRTLGRCIAYEHRGDANEANGYDE